MDLQQEYFARHGLDVAPVCYPDNKGNYSIVLKNLDAKRFKQPRYMVVTITLHKQETHPSYFKITQMLPAHDSQVNGDRTGVSSVWDKKVYWDEWDTFIRTWTANNMGELVPVSGDELVLAVWEMFMYSHDSWLAQNLHDRQKDGLFTLMDDTLPIKDRLAAVQEVEEMIRGKSKNVFSTISNLRGYGEGRFHAGWIGKLF